MLKLKLAKSEESIVSC